MIDRFEAARAVADAVLYEGYVLYPYRASSQKNQARWQFGVLVPRRFSEADGSERWAMHSECLVDPGADPVLAVRIRCLQVQHRTVERVVVENDANGEDPRFVAVQSLEVCGQRYVEWDEAVDHAIDVGPFPLGAGGCLPATHRFTLGGGSDTELVRAADGAVVGRVIRQREPIEGLVRVSAEGAARHELLKKIGVTVENQTECTDGRVRRDEIIGLSLVAVHTMLAVDGGTFVSLLDPPADARTAVAECHSDGAFPVLIGGSNLVLSSPIILYDQPEVAPESPSDLYDATEIDEILALRVLTLTDDEKAEARGTDRRAAAVIDRCEEMTPESWGRLHGAVRPFAPTIDPVEDPIVDPPSEKPEQTVMWWDPEIDSAVDPWTDSVWIDGIEVGKGSAVRLSPSHRSDAQDLFLVGRTAIVAGVFKDVDGTQQVAVTIDDDPAADELVWQGRFLFFFPDEVEPLVDTKDER